MKEERIIIQEEDIKRYRDGLRPIGEEKDWNKIKDKIERAMQWKIRRVKEEKESNTKR